MITIITATYNAAETLADNLACIKEQAIPVEHLLVDGGSTDGTLDLIRDYCPPLTSQAPHLSRYTSEPDQGIYDAMNKGIAMATGDIVGILNADDFYANADVLTKVAAVFEDPAVDACYGDLTYVAEGQGSGRLKPDFGINPSPLTPNSSHFSVTRYWKSGSFQPNKFYWGWMPPHPTFFVRRSVYDKYGVFNLDLGSAADYEIMLRFLLNHKIKTAYIPEVLVNMRVGGVSNASVGNRVNANRNDRKAWAVNGLKPYPWTMLMKPMRKVPQWWMRP